MLQERQLVRVGGVERYGIPAEKLGRSGFVEAMLQRDEWLEHVEDIRVVVEQVTCES